MQLWIKSAALQVLNNLVSNAVKFTETGTITISAQLGSPNRGRPRSSGAFVGREDAEEVVEVSVQDTGLGIPEDKLKAIFLPFEQVGFNAQQLCCPCIHVPHGA